MAHARGELQTALVAAVRDGKTTPKEIAAALGMEPKKISNGLMVAVRRNRLTRVGLGAYALPNGAASAPTNGNGAEPTVHDTRRRVSQDDRLAVMLAQSGMRPRTEDEWLRVLQFIEVARGVLS